MILILISLTINKSENRIGIDNYVTYVAYVIDVAYVTYVIDVIDVINVIDVIDVTYAISKLSWIINN